MEPLNGMSPPNPSGNPTEEAEKNVRARPDGGHQETKPSKSI